MAPCKILIIDDDEEDVQILAEAFQICGIDRVHYVFTAMQAFMYLQNVKNKEDLPKLIITDIYLPGITGTQFLADLKLMEQYWDIHVIVLTTTKSEKQIEEALLLGAEDYLTKPNTYEEYVQVAKEIKDKIEL